MYVDTSLCRHAPLILRPPPPFTLFQHGRLYSLTQTELQRELGRRWKNAQRKREKGRREEKIDLFPGTKLITAFNLWHEHAFVSSTLKSWLQSRAIVWVYLFYICFIFSVSLMPNDLAKLLCSSGRCSLFFLSSHSLTNHCKACDRRMNCFLCNYMRAFE